MAHPPAALQRGLLLAPLIFAVHVAEEAPGFVAWMNAHVADDITPQLFWTVNLSGFALTLLVIAVARMAGPPAGHLLAAAWFGFLMLGNAVLHLAATLHDGSYAPGVVTALTLYLPYSVWLGRALIRARAVPMAGLALAAGLGALPMLIHGYRIIFLGTRLF
jgi:hypothetical protein